MSNSTRNPFFFDPLESVKAAAKIHSAALDMTMTTWTAMLDGQTQLWNGGWTKIWSLSGGVTSAEQEAASKPAAKVAPKAAPKPAAKAAPKPAVKAAPKPAVKAAPKPAAKVAPAPAAKPVAEKVVAKPAVAAKPAPVQEKTVAAAPVKTTPATTKAPATTPAKAPVKAAAPKAAPAKTTPAAPVAAAPVSGKPAGLKAPRAGKADDLTTVKGIGPKMAEQLNAAGIFHFDQIAAWTAGEVAWLDDNLKGVRGSVSRDNWVSQAAALAKG